MIKRNSYAVEFKRQIAFELLSGQTSIAAVSKREGITSATLAKWRDKYGLESGGGSEELDKAELNELRRKLAHYEAALGELALENHILKKFQEFTVQQKKRNSSSKTTSPNILVSKKVARRSE
jgi:transposase-like protein